MHLIAFKFKRVGKKPCQNGTDLKIKVNWKKIHFNFIYIYIIKT